ncbi:hypothetical protein [Lelliottia amnigena]
MKEKKHIFILMSLYIVVLSSAYATYVKNKTPSFVEEATLRVQSYLSKEYGPSECKSNVELDKKWKLRCLVIDKSESYEFTLLPSDLAPYSVVRSFYLKADNENSRNSASQGLMPYLQIDTDISKR